MNRRIHEQIVIYSWRGYSVNINERDLHTSLEGSHKYDSEKHMRVTMCSIMPLIPRLKLVNTVVVWEIAFAQWKSLSIVTSKLARRSQNRKAYRSK